ncbi:MAG: hypothetical protein Q7R31_03640 [Candidatus Levybacteria bacterium]|nr:hypothetical protein [Candidatus Levybacteria bacterium]
MGKAKNLKKRVSNYFTNATRILEKTKLLISEASKIKTVQTSSEIEAFLLEANYIKKYKPKFNVKLADGKAYPLIRITIKDKYPKVLIARKTDDKNSLYFGPYPQAKPMRIVIRIIRKIFPFQSVPNHGKGICLYHHLGLCPCPGVFDSLEFKKEYKKNIKHLVAFLSGKTKKVISDLKKERSVLSKKEEFEKANLIQQKINAIELITHSYSLRFDQDIDPNTKEDLEKSSVDSLKITFRSYGINVADLHRIECFDISNISGKFAVGSMAVFVNGRKDKSLYRKFRIKNNYILPDDFSMMEEVLRRRIQHKEWSFPNLIIVDGGKGQVSSALKALNENNIKIPVVGLAKKEETIITSSFKEIILPKDSGALKLMMEIRDEAHRFAITYHKKLRSKSFISS